jgi:hypothetical protein
MATVSDAFSAADPAAAASGGLRETTDSAVAVPEGTRTRESVRVTQRDGKAPTLRGLLTTMRADWDGAWWWAARPASLTEVMASRVPHPDNVPDGSKWLRYGWVVWMHLVAIPVTAGLLPLADRARPRLVRQLARGLVWMFQHPARAGLGALVAGPVIAMWIAF